MAVILQSALEESLMLLETALPLNAVRNRIGMEHMLDATGC
jgi:hypothetical protein